MILNNDGQQSKEKPMQLSRLLQPFSHIYSECTLSFVQITQQQLQLRQLGSRNFSDSMLLYQSMISQ